MVEYVKPKERPSWLSAEQYAQLPETLVVREVRYTIPEHQRRTRAITLVTTLLAPERYPAKDLAKLYSLHWTVELFFKECKGTLGLHRYRFRKFVQVENWVQACLVSFVYLEWYRAWQLRRRDGEEGEKGWWRWQRCYGVSVAIGQATEQDDLRRV